MSAAKACEIYSIVHRNSSLWKWRYRDADGSVTVCAEEYGFFLQCVAAARARGYEPRTDWTSPCALIVTQDRKRKKDFPK